MHHATTPFDIHIAFVQKVQQQQLLRCNSQSLCILIFCVFCYSAIFRPNHVQYPVSTLLSGCQEEQVFIAFIFMAPIHLSNPRENSELSFPRVRLQK